MNRRWMGWLVAAAVLLTVLGWGWLSLRPAQVTAWTVHQAPLVQTLQVSARVASSSRVDLGSTLTGRVRDVQVAEGALVQAGQVLLRLHSDEWQAALAQAQANEQQAHARWNGLRSTGRIAVQAQVAQAEAVWVNAQADWRRTQDLVAQGFVSQLRLDEARRTMGVARAQLDAALAQRDANADTGAEAAQAQAQWALAVAARQAAQARLDEATLVAPAPGRVLVRSAEPGQIVQPGRALLTLAVTGPVQLVAQVDERYLEQLAPGQTARVVADAYPDQGFAARVLSIAPRVDAQRGAIEVKFSIVEPAPEWLRDDMTVSVEVETARLERALVVPVSALRSTTPDGDTREAEVWVAPNGRVEARPVQLGARTLAWAEVREGLREGDAVLTGPAPGLGERVRVVPGLSGH